MMISRIIGENLRRVFFFFNFLYLQIWASKICNQDILKTITARSFKLGKVKEDNK